MRTLAIMRARVLVGLAVVAAVLGMSVQTAAAAAPRLSASAFWDMGNTDVSLQVSEQAGGTTSFFLFAQEAFCDTAANEWVIRSFFSQGPVSSRQVAIRPSLRSATLSATVPVSGSESRSPDCANPGNPTSFTNLGASTVTIDVSWTGTGATYEVQPGITGRAAVATGSITGTAFNPGALGTSTNAELRSSTL